MINGYETLGDWLRSVERDLYPDPSADAFAAAAEAADAMDADAAEGRRALAWFDGRDQDSMLDIERDELVEVIGPFTGDPCEAIGDRTTRSPKDGADAQEHRAWRDALLEMAAGLAESFGDDPPRCAGHLRNLATKARRAVEGAPRWEPLNTLVVDVEDAQKVADALRLLGAFS